MIDLAILLLAYAPLPFPKPADKANAFPAGVWWVSVTELDGTVTQEKASFRPDGTGEWERSPMRWRLSREKFRPAGLWIEMQGREEPPGQPWAAWIEDVPSGKGHVAGRPLTMRRIR